MKGALITLGIILSLSVIFVSMFVSSNNEAVSHESGIKAQYSDMQNVLSEYSLKVKEAAQIPGMSIDGLTKVMKEALSSRYGANGSQATMQWIKETYPGQVDNALYAKVQQIIEGGRDQYQNSQTSLIDKKRSYEVALGSIPGGMFMKMMGYPKINMDDYKIVVSEHAQDAFKTGVEKPLDFHSAASDIQ